MFAQLKARLRPLRVYRAARFGFHFVRDPIFRRDHLLLWRRTPHLFQHRTVTEPDRYPGVFHFLREQVRARSDLRILSFGCATGEEVFSLREYFPQAFIKGIDINRDNIATCRARHCERGSDPSLVFDQGHSAANEPADSFDAVLCMAVFVRPQIKNRAVTTCAPHLRFADFERVITELAACVKPGGYLVLRSSMFRFADTRVASGFSHVRTMPLLEPGFPQFGPDDLILPDTGQEEVIFRKQGRAPHAI